MALALWIAIASGANAPANLRCDLLAVDGKSLRFDVQFTPGAMTPARLTPLPGGRWPTTATLARPVGAQGESRIKYTIDTGDHATLELGELDASVSATLVEKDAGRDDLPLAVGACVALAEVSTTVTVPSGESVGFLTRLGERRPDDGQRGMPCVVRRDGRVSHIRYDLTSENPALIPLDNVIWAGEIGIKERLLPDAPPPQGAVRRVRVFSDRATGEIMGLNSLYFDSIGGRAVLLLSFFGSRDVGGGDGICGVVTASN